MSIRRYIVFSDPPPAGAVPADPPVLGTALGSVITRTTMDESKLHILRDGFEPAFIVLAFTIGTLINRRHPIWELDDIEASDPERSPRVGERSPVRSLKPAIVHLFTHPLETFPFLVEILYWNLTYWPYQGLRALSARLIDSNPTVFAVARTHALSILTLETRLGIAIELPFQQHVLTHLPFLASQILPRIYYSHISLGVCFLIYIYTYLPAPTFRRIRRTIFLDNVIAFVIITLWRCMPPRMLPAEYRFVDVLHGGGQAGIGGEGTGGASAWTNNRFQLTIAAMPSLHFGTALFFAWCICRFSPHRWMKFLAPLWPAMMLFTIIATANHFVLDAVVGALVPVLAWRYNRVVLVLEPVQGWVVRWVMKGRGQKDEYFEKPYF